MIHGEGTAAPDTMALSAAGAVMLCPAVPSLFGTRDQFLRRQFFHGWVVGGMVQAVTRMMGSNDKW